ncbi:MAG: hypothetical protein R6U36_12305 [Candidatus Fermentibacteraceae bacterium]
MDTDDREQVDPRDPEERNRYKASLAFAQLEGTSSTNIAQGFVADRSETYQGGLFAVVTPERVYNNLVAIELVFNQLNALQTDYARAKKEIEELKAEREDYKPIPKIQIMSIALDVAATISIALGFGRNPNDMTMIYLGGAILVLSRASNLLRPYLAKRRRSEE